MSETKRTGGRPWNAMPKFDFWVVEREIVPTPNGRYGADVLCEVHDTEARYGEPARTAEENARRIADALNDAEGWYGPRTEATEACNEALRRPDLDEVAEYLERRMKAVLADNNVEAGAAYSLALDYVRGARFNVIEGDVRPDAWTEDHSLAQGWLADHVGRDHAMGPAVDSLVALLREQRTALPETWGDPGSCLFGGCHSKDLVSRARTSGANSSKGVGEDGSVGYDLAHNGRRALVTFTADGDVEILLTKAPRTEEKA